MQMKQTRIWLDLRFNGLQKSNVLQKHLKKVAAILDPPPTCCSETKSQERDRKLDDVEYCFYACYSKKLKVEIPDQKSGCTSVLREISSDQLNNHCLTLEGAYSLRMWYRVYGTSITYWNCTIANSLIHLHNSIKISCTVVFKGEHHKELYPLAQKQYSSAAALRE